MEREQKPAFAGTGAGKKENIWNGANVLTFFRIVFSFLAVYFAFAGFSVICVTIAFIAGMLTDLFDGQVARRLKIETEFGRKFDVVADRILMLGAVLAVIKLGASGILTKIHFLQVCFILSREIITAPVALVAIIRGAGIPRVRFIGKLTTFLQAITFPAILLSAVYKFFSFSLYFAIATSIVGLISAFYYINDMRNLMAKE